MELIACDGTWQHAQDGTVLCTGTLQVVVGGGPFGLPPMTYTDANLLLIAIGTVWASVFAIRQARRLL
ncbi:hypothetical protein [Alcanivorax sp.]|uniref:hypothetical protein n=1 Tax=Alcanivorax sp. TaxID=1872427 RepID=UPI000C3B58CD|nr:hypothetical protein [Alcanivorax sp.]MBQ26080.1 hypothetical protein [Alcanivorax sp.]|tara:strand:+ start:560 stop:763 length:204 start_codon:yes stop_codon:yes gene_type:complete